MFLIGFIVLLVVMSSAFGLYWRAIPKAKTAEEFLAEEIRDSTVYMLAQPVFSGDEFEKQILGKGKMEWFDRKKREAYFTFPQAEQAEFDEFVAKYFANRAKLDMGIGTGGKIKLGEYTWTISPETGYFFKTAMDNIKIEPKQTLNFAFKTANYSLNLDEMKGFTDNSKVYGGKLIAEAPTSKNQMRIVFANHGIMVAKPNEPSLMRLTGELLKDAGDNREARIQRLLDFVSNEIEYSYTEAVAPRETLKRANETLMTRIGDCSNKTILLASMLEQIGEDYILVYSPQHITVAVPQGNFTNENKIDVDYENKKYVIAESTLPGYQIGKTKVAQVERLVNVDYIQSPKQIDLIFDARSYTYLNFW